MIDFEACSKEQLISVLEEIAYRIVQENSVGWYEVTEDDVFEFLCNEGLPVKKS